MSEPEPREILAVANETVGGRSLLEAVKRYAQAGPIRVTVNGVKVPTGRTKVGSFFGDHTKTGLNTLLNCGSAVGAFCNLLPTGSYLPTTVPSFTICNGTMSELWDLRQLFQTASVVMRRRGCELTDAHTDLYFALYEATAGLRRHILREHEQRRLRRSV